MGGGGESKNGDSKFFFFYTICKITILIKAETDLTVLKEEVPDPEYVFLILYIRGIVGWSDVASISLRLFGNILYHIRGVVMVGCGFHIYIVLVSYLHFENIWMRDSTYLIFRLCFQLYIRAL